MDTERTAECIRLQCRHNNITIIIIIVIVIVIVISSSRHRHRHRHRHHHHHHHHRHRHRHRHPLIMHHVSEVACGVARTWLEKSDV